MSLLFFAHIEFAKTTSPIIERIKEEFTMMNFIMMTLAVMLGSLLALVFIMYIAFNKKVVKAYMKWATKLTMEIQKEILEDLEKENEA